MVQVIGLQGTALQRLDPGLGDLLAQLRVLDPLDLGPQLPHRFTHACEVIILRHYADLSFKEIASLTNCSINTALGRMRYGLINLRKMMTEKRIAL